jgi:hypothetical protein
MNIEIFIMIIGVAIAPSLFIWNEISKLRSDIKEEISLIKSDMASQSARSDKLYEMFIDLLKERK